MRRRERGEPFGMSTEERHKPDVLRSYEGEGIVVHWEPKLCIHTANCLRALPPVFNVDRRPWVNVTAANAGAIAAAVESCPTGALSYMRTDGEPAEDAPVPARVQPRTNGPLFVRGSIVIIDSQGNAVREATRLALCRCGQSANKPYCDLSHRAAGFRAE